MGVTCVAARGLGCDGLGLRGGMNFEHYWGAEQHPPKQRPTARLRRYDRPPASAEKVRKFSSDERCKFCPEPAYRPARGRRQAAGWLCSYSYSTQRRFLSLGLPRRSTYGTQPQQRPFRLWIRGPKTVENDADKIVKKGIMNLRKNCEKVLSNCVQNWGVAKRWKKSEIWCQSRGGQSSLILLRRMEIHEICLLNLEFLVR